MSPVSAAKNMNDLNCIRINGIISPVSFTSNVLGRRAMVYQSVGDRIAVDFSTWPGIDAERACSTLQKQGFRREIFDPEWYAQGLIGRRNVFYACGLHSKNAPKAVDCSSLMKYLFGLCGIWIPRRAVKVLHQTGTI